jgi:hypothetical protein
MKLVSIESPYHGWTERNEAYAVLCVLDSIRRGEAPFASHLMYPRVMGHGDPDDKRREKGLEISDAWRLKADLIAFYLDYEWSAGMTRARFLAINNNIAMEERYLFK